MFNNKCENSKPIQMSNLGIHKIHDFNEHYIV